MPRGRVVRALIRRDLLVSSSYRVAFLLDLFFGFANLLIYCFISRTFEDVSTEDLQPLLLRVRRGRRRAQPRHPGRRGAVSRLREEQLTGASRPSSRNR